MSFDEELSILNNLFKNNRLYDTFSKNKDDNDLSDILEAKIINLETRMLKALYEQKKKNFDLQQNLKNEKVRHIVSVK